MKVFKSVKAFRLEIETLKSAGKSIGFVPTMGALHAGHMSLIKKAKQNTDLCVCSIFVNPKQFNEATDFEKYPRQVELDLSILEENKCDIVFTPEVDEIFPVPDNNSYDFGTITNGFEGKHRPGHFNGVASVVKRFFEIIEPDKAFFGRKDYQQLMMVSAMVKKHMLPVEIIAGEIIREKTGLAMSSRNKRLSLSDKQRAVKISATLFKIACLSEQLPISELITLGRTDLNSDPEIELEYFDIVSPDTLLPVRDDFKEAVALIAARVGNVRLIDNIIIKN